MSNNPLWNENNFFGRMVALACIAFLVGVGLIVVAVTNTNRKGANVGFMDDKFVAIAVYEDDEKASAKLMEACKGKYDEAKPDSVFSEDEGERKFYRVNVKADGLPPPAFIQINPPVIRGAKPVVSPIYAIFKEPKATNKLRSWAKDNQYPDWNFKLKWRDQSKYETAKVSFSKPGSSVSIVAFYESKGRIYLWDGEKVNDCSAGLTSNAGGKKGETHYRDYMKWLASLGQ